MAENTIRSDSLRKALRFLDVRSASTGGFVTRELTGGGGKIMSTSKVQESGTRRGRVGLDMVVVTVPALKAGSIPQLAQKLDVNEDVIRDLSGLSLRTYKRRQAAGAQLTNDEADRVLRIARVASEAERVFGDLGKASRWLSKKNVVLGAAPLSLLATDAGTHEVEAELTRIDWGDVA